MEYSISFPKALLESLSHKRIDRLNYEFNKNMKAAARFGESKHDLKIRNHKVANETNAPYKQPRGMFGIGAAETYEKQGGIAICAILRKHPDLKHLSDFVPFVAEYVGYMITSGLSPATICTRVHALVTALGVEDYHAFGLT
ncbi:MAG: hypothetical protein PHP22_07790, partial [Oscillospiraceae bacterium]|nr:hypothetical protein [Oscillospiraceae bacterium]